jgi:hypothetical protein
MPPACLPSTFDRLRRSGARCLITNSPIDLEYIREQGRAGRLVQVLGATKVARIPT